MANVVIYTWTVCPYCVRAKSLLKSMGVAFTEINLDGKDEDFMNLQKKTKWKTMPQIFIGEEFIGGYVDLVELENRGELNRLLEK